MFTSRSKCIIGCIWVAALLVLYTYLQHIEIALWQVPGVIEEWLVSFGLYKAASLYIILFCLRPLVLFPAGALTIISGAVFGPWWSIALTIIGENMSANIVFRLARFMGREAVEKHESDFVKTWEHKLHDNGLVTVLILRLIYSPFDLLSALCGVTEIEQKDFALGTFIGILPGLVMYAFLGGAVGGDEKKFFIGIAAVLFVIGLLLAWVLKPAKMPKKCI